MPCRLMQYLKKVAGWTTILSPNFMKKLSCILDPHSPGHFKVSHLPPWRWRRQWRNNYMIERGLLVRWSLILNYFVKSSSESVMMASLPWKTLPMDISEVIYVRIIMLVCPVHLRICASIKTDRRASSGWPLHISFASMTMKKKTWRNNSRLNFTLQVSLVQSYTVILGLSTQCVLQVILALS